MHCRLMVRHWFVRFAHGDVVGVGVGAGVGALVDGDVQCSLAVQVEALFFEERRPGIGVPRRLVLADWGWDVKLPLRRC